jgi:hypothetical protein
VTANELRELLAVADEAARVALAAAAALLRPGYNKGRLPDKHMLAAAWRQLIRMIPSFGSLGFVDVVASDTELRITERRVGPALFHPTRWRIADGDGPPCIAVGTLWLSADTRRLEIGAAVERLFALGAVDAWLAAHPGPAPDCRGPRCKAWTDHGLVAAMVEDVGWVGETAEGVDMCGSAAYVRLCTRWSKPRPT